MARRDYSGWTEQNYIDAVKQLDASNQEDLRRKDSGLYLRMKNEGLLDKIVPQKEPEFTFDYFKNEVEKIGATNRRQLITSNRSLYMKGKRQGYIDDLFGSINKDYEKITFEEFKNEVENLGVRTKTDLRYLDKELYDKGKEEGWFGNVFKSERRVKSSKEWTLEDFIARVKELGATTRSELQRFDSGLYVKVGLKNKDWMDMAFGNAIYVDYSNWTFEDYKSAVQELQPKNKTDLKRKSLKLYQKCSKLGILNNIFGISNKRDYSKWTEEEFRKEVQKLKATGRHDLQNKDRSLYDQLRKQGLLEIILPGKVIIKRERRIYTGWTENDYKNEIKKVNARSKTDLAMKDNGLYKRLTKIGLLDACFEKNESDSIESILESYVDGDNE